MIRHMVALLFMVSVYGNTSLADSNDHAGKQTYDMWCGHCHEPSTGPHPGTQMLTLSRGSEFALIKGNDNLQAEYIRTVVRRGLGMMPALRKTEISDEHLNALILYLKSEE